MKELNLDNPWNGLTSSFFLKVFQDPWEAILGHVLQRMRTKKTKTR